MRRILFGIGLAAVMAGVPTVAQETAKKAEAPKTEKVDAKKLIKETQDKILELQKELRSAKPDDRAKIIEKVAEQFDKVVAALEADAKGPDAIELALAAQGLVTKKEAADKLNKVIEENLLEHPKLAPLAMSLGQRDPKLLEKIEKANKSPDVQAVVAYVKAQTAFRKFEAKENKENADAVLALVKAIPADMKPIQMPRGVLDVAKMAKQFQFAIENLSVGKKMPDLSSKDLDGKEVKLSGHQGKVVVLDIWATWCPPCKAMIPHERELVEKLKDKPFTLISVSGDAEVKTLKDFLETEKMPWVHWFDGQDGNVMKTLNISAFPTIYVLDAKGVIRYKGVRGEKMDEAVETLLKEMESKKTGN